jgi:integrase
MAKQQKSSTRNAQGGGSIRQRKDGKWEARYTTGRDPGTGKQIQKSVYGNTQAEVRKKLVQISATIDEGTYTEPSRLTVGAWLDIWLSEYAVNSIKPSTLHNYKKCCNSYLKPNISAIKLTAINAPSIQKMINALHTGSDSKKGLAPKTIKNIHGVLHKALQQAVKLGFIRSNPADACTLPRLAKKEIKPLDREQITSFLEAIQGHEFETLYLITLFTGMRQSETLGLRWQCVDFAKGTILVNAQLLRNYGEGGYYFDESTKNNKFRKITPAKFVMTALKKHKVEQMKSRLLAGVAWVESDYVFTNALGEHLKHVTVYKGYKRIVSSLGIPSARYHDLRHSYAVSALQAGDDVKTVQENMGHHTAAFTLDVYGHVTEQMKKDSADRMDMFIKGIKQGR